MTNEQIATALAAKSNDELYAYIENREKYLPVTVKTAVAELETRNITFTPEELQVIHEDMKARVELAQDEPGQSIFTTGVWKYRLVDDEFAPKLFSQLVVFVFSILFGVLFGSVLMAVNISKTQNRDKAFMIVVYGFLFEIAAGFLLGGSVAGAVLIILAKVLGGFLLTSFYWKSLIGADMLYKARPIWVPLAIGILLLAANLGLYLYMAHNGQLKNLIR
jgi:hypothetical protein